MALTVREIVKTAARDRYMHLYRIDFDSSYPTGGESLTSADLGFSDLSSLLAVVAFPQNGFTFQYDGTNAKLKAFTPLKIMDATLDAANRTAVTSGDESATTTGLATTDIPVSVSLPAAASAGVAAVSVRNGGANTSTIRLTNPSAGAVDLASGSYRVTATGALGEQVEVIDTKDLSAVTGVIVMAFGKVQA